MRNILEYLEHSAQMFPDKAAVLDQTDMRTYSQLICDARCIGTAISQIAPPRAPVVVYMDKSPRALTAFLGVVHAGCFYVFISPDQPVQRLRQILVTAQAACAITEPGLSDKLTEAGFSAPVVFFEEAVNTQPDCALLSRIRAQALDIDPLYCNFTSGSSGTPKGVLVSHRSVIDFMDVFPDMFHITSEDVIGNQAPFDFDVSVKDIYSTLKTGATMVIIPRRLFSIVTELLDYLCRHRVTTLIWAVTALCMVAQFRGLSYRVPKSVSKILFSGEVMPEKYLRMWQDCLPDASYVNLYGPTEITCNCTFFRVPCPLPAGEKLPIGQPFPNERVFLLDGQDRLVDAENTPGEICVSGTALALGYLNNPEQTARAFVQNPLNTSHPEIIYRTGDLAYYDSAGNLCFAGRKDFQIKYMGHRIELEEIESAINSLPQVRRACCVFDAERSRLTAFYAGEGTPAQLKIQLHDRLPAYMIPSVFRQLPELPVTANGKIDRRLLASMGGENSEPR